MIFSHIWVLPFFIWARLHHLDSKMAASGTVIRDTVTSVMVSVTSRKWWNSRRLLRGST